MNMRGTWIFVLIVGLTGCVDKPKSNMGQSAVEDTVPETGEGDPKMQAALEAYGRGEGHREKGEFDKAIAEFSEAITLNPQYADAFGNRGIAYAGIGEFEKAIDDFNEVIRLDPKCAAAYYNRGRAYHDKGEFDRAIADFDEAIGLDPEYVDAYSNRGIALAERGDFDKATDDFNEVIRRNPRDVEAVGNRGMAYVGMGQFDKAMEDFNEVIRRNPDDALAYYNRACAFDEKGDYDNAIADSKEAIRLSPNDADYHNGLAWLLATCADAKYRDGQKAVEHATKACELTNWKENWVFDTLAAAYAETGDYENAVKWQQKATDMANDEEKEDYQSRLDVYKAGKPYREDPRK
jgi:tetratricopeptide (TPR) repeat protein